MLDARDIRLIVPQVRRYLAPGVASASAASSYTDDHLVQVTADAIGELILISGGDDPFGYSIAASAVDGSGFITDYYTEPEIALVDRSLVAIQAAIGQVFGELRDMKTSEKIANEGSSWEWQKSVTGVQEKLKQLLALRRLIFERAAEGNRVLDGFVDLIEVRAPTVFTEISPQ